MRTRGTCIQENDLREEARFEQQRIATQQTNAPSITFGYFKSIYSIERVEMSMDYGSTRYLELRELAVNRVL